MIRDVVATLPFPGGAVVTIERVLPESILGRPAEYELALFAGDRVIERRRVSGDADRLAALADAMQFEHARRAATPLAVAA